jgi:peptidyl-prolyl cis-trans isomerase D
MRKDFKKYSWTLWLVIIVFIGGFAMTDMFRGEARRKNDLIFIGDKIVKAEEYQEQLLKTLQDYKLRLKENFSKSMILQFRIPEQTREDLIRRTILQMEAKKLQITASDDELSNKIMSLPYFQKDGKFVGIELYQRALSNARIHIKDFENDLKDQIILEKFIKLITSGLVIDEDTLWDKYKKEKDSAEVEYIILKPDIIKEKINVAEEEIQDYYQANKEDFKSEERRSGHIIALKFDDHKKEITIDDMELYDYFKENKTQFIDPAKTKVSRIFLKYDEKNSEEILKKAESLREDLTIETFAQRAKELSEDEKAKEGGDYGYYEWQKFSKQEKSMIDSMEQNEISSPVNTLKGYAILMVTEKKEKTQKEFDKVKPIIKDRIEKQRLDNLVQNKLSKIYTKIKDEKNIKSKAETLGFKVIETESLTMSDSMKEVDSSGTLTRQLFNLKDQEISTPVMYPEGMAIIQLVKIDEPAVEPLDKVKEKVREEVVKKNKVKLLQQRAETISKELNRFTDDKAIEKYLKDKDLSATPTTYKRGNRIGYLPAKEGLDNMVFSMEENRYSQPIDLESEILLVNVKSKKINQRSDFEKEKKEFYTKKIDQLKNTYFSSYLSNKREKYEVRINQKLFDEINNHILSRFN